MGSRSWPSSVMALVRRARMPSTVSVSVASRKTPRASHSWPRKRPAGRPSERASAGSGRRQGVGQRSSCGRSVAQFSGPVKPRAQAGRVAIGLRVGIRIGLAGARPIRRRAHIWNGGSPCPHPRTRHGASVRSLRCHRAGRPRPSSGPEAGQARPGSSNTDPQLRLAGYDELVQDEGGFEVQGPEVAVPRPDQRQRPDAPTSPSSRPRARPTRSTPPRLRAASGRPTTRARPGRRSSTRAPSTAIGDIALDPSDPADRLGRDGRSQHLPQLPVRDRRL